MGTVDEPRLRFLTDPKEFLAAAGGFLAADPVISTVVSAVTHRAVTDLADGVAVPADSWWLVVTDGSGSVVGAGMRTARSWLRPLFLLPMSEAAAAALARELHGRGEEVLALNGVLPAARVCAEVLARLGGGRVEGSVHMRLHELGELVPPSPVPGGLRPAGEQDLDLVIEWLDAFMGDADEQAGRVRGASTHEQPDADTVLRQVRAGRFRFWCDPSGESVSMVGASPPAFGVSNIGPVYTPPDRRGRGWASNAVAAVSRTLQAQDARVCLFTDQANPTSNRIYAALGYRPVVDTANLLIRRE